MHNMRFPVVYPYNGVIMRHKIPLFKMGLQWFDYGYNSGNYQPTKSMGHSASGSGMSLPRIRQIPLFMF